MAAEAKTKDSHRLPGWIWLITGTLLGALIMFLMRLSELQPGNTSSKPQTKQEGSKETHFSFYDLLKDTEVPVTQKSTSKQSTTQAAEDYDYLLQVASFTSLEDAEQVRAELTLLNFKAHVESAKVDSGKTWHRVLVGPFDSRSKLAKARSTLLSNRYEAMRIKRKKES